MEPTEIFRMPLVLQIVKHRYHRGTANDGSGKSRIEQYVDALLRDRKRKDELLPQNASRPKRRTDLLRRMQKIRLLRNQVRARLAIREHNVVIHRVDRSQRLQQVPHIYLSAANASRDEIKRVNANPDHLLADPRQSFTRGLIPPLDRQR